MHETLIKNCQALLPEKVFSFCRLVEKHGGQAIVVGGWVRDRIMHLPCHVSPDIDIEVFGINYEILYRLCSNTIVAAYPHFGTLKTKDFDISIPRVEHCCGKKYNDFHIQLLPNLPFDKAAQRRDFTINAIGWEPLNDKVLDPFNGIRSVSQRILTPITVAFKEDSSRILRAVQLIARFNFSPSQTLIQCGQAMSDDFIAPKHIALTLETLMRSNFQENALRFLKTIGWDSMHKHIEQKLRA